MSRRRADQFVFSKKRGQSGTVLMFEYREPQQLIVRVTSHVWSLLSQVICCHFHCFCSEWSCSLSAETLIPVLRGFEICFEGWTAWSLNSPRFGEQKFLMLSLSFSSWKYFLIANFTTGVQSCIVIRGKNSFHWKRKPNLFCSHYTINWLVP